MSASDPAQASSLTALVAAAARKAPSSTAIVRGSTSVSYAQLLELSQHLAGQLADSGVTDEHVVALDMTSSPRLVAAMIATGMVGAAFLPLDPHDRSRRRELILSDARPAVVVTQDDLVRRSGAERIAGRLAPQRSPAAYLSYTSGSTGEPKGVVTEQHAIVNYVTAAIDAYELKPGDRQLQFASIAFDVAIDEIFSTLGSGSALVLRDPDFVYGDVGEFLAHVDERAISVLNLPTGVWNQFGLGLRGQSHLRLPAALRLVVVGGEAAMQEACSGWHSAADRDDLRIVNAYGPTEAAVSVTFAELRPDRPIAIGRPIPGVDVMPVDATLTPVADGQLGELLITGCAPARGYLDKPELTARTFGTLPAGRYYRTGDLGRRLPDGALEFHGRVDEQIKVRGGYRVEPGEVVRVLLSHPAIAEAHVRVTERSMSRGLAAFVVARSDGAATLQESHVRAHLADRLPPYLIPAAVTIVANLPLTERGKVDVAALDRISAARQPAARDPLDVDAIRAALAAGWLATTGVVAAGDDANFVEDGGDSLAALELLEHLRRQLGFALPMRSLYRSPTFGRIMEELVVDRAAVPAVATTTGRTVVRLRRAGTRRLWCFLPPLSGSVIRYAGLARLLPLEDAVWACETPAELSRGGMAVLATALAENLVREGAGDFESIVLSGYSLGGIFAVEVARRLAGAVPMSTDVELLLLDPPDPSDSRHTQADAVDVFVRIGWRIDTTPSSDLIRSDGSLDYAGIAAAARACGTLASNGGEDDIADAWQAYESNAQILHGYELGPVPGLRASLLRCEPRRAGEASNGHRWLRAAPTEQWRGVVGPGRAWSLPIEHETMLEAPHDAQVAAWLTATARPRSRP
jgi:amino acid adenylation domain-containing protein